VLSAKHFQLGFPPFLARHSSLHSASAKRSPSPAALLGALISMALESASVFTFNCSPLYSPTRSWTRLLEMPRIPTSSFYSLCLSLWRGHNFEWHHFYRGICNARTDIRISMDTKEEKALNPCHTLVRLSQSVNSYLKRKCLARKRINSSL